MANREAKVQEFLARMKTSCPQLFDEIQSTRPTGGLGFESVGGGAAAAPRMVQETIVMKKGRPVLEIAHDEARLVFADVESQFWRDRLKAARAPLVKATRAVGRIEVANHPNFEWLGTGWLVQPDIVVTNRHVAAEFGRKRGDAFIFRSSFMGPMSANIDFVEEFGRSDSNEMKLREILHIEDEDGPDLAFLRVEPAGAALAAHIPLSTREAQLDQFVAVIGYPARDSRIPDLDVMEEIFGDVFDKKRLAPGQLRAPDQGSLVHDCSTLGGNSGSVVLDLASGEAIGVHFAGAYLQANYAVPAALVADRLSRIGRNESRGGVSVPAVEADERTVQMPAAATGTRSISCVIPIRVNIEIGDPQMDSAAASAPVSAGLLDAEEAAIQTEARVEDYAGREGYKAGFLGSGLSVPLPTIVRDAAQVLEFDIGGETQTELKYHHFSVVMHRARRVCFYSAVNLDGKLSDRSLRPEWRLDPRIPREEQIKGECYGNPPKFSRGHMTRREDPAWGKTTREINLGAADSMHVTNAVPQMQSFNAGIWLTLEEYALQNARQDDQRISVITGPFFTAADPVRFGVKIPKAFWKVIAFVHDETGELTVTGYSISQEDHIPNTEFVFGEFGTHQRALKWIEARAGISFGNLSEHDPMSTGNEALEGPSRPLKSLGKIQFTKKRT